MPVVEQPPWVAGQAACELNGEAAAVAGGGWQ